MSIAPASHLPNTHTTPISRRALQALSFTLAMAGLTACGGGDANNSPAPSAAAPAAPAAPVAPTPPPPPPPPAAASTTLSGAVVKGPVAGAQVCAYTVVGSARGTALGSCTTTDASGNYSFAVPLGSGALWLEASGGSYTDEATGASTSLPAGAPLLGLATATGTTATSMLTPLTTLSLNAARNNVGASGTLDASSYAAAATQLLAAFNLPSTLNISTTLPAFGAGINSYGTALTVVSQMVANGLPLATLLATAQPATLATAYATAAAPPPVAAGAPSASGSLTVAGTTAPGAATSLAPQADGFEVAVNAGGALSYRFFRESTAAPASKVEVTVSVSLTGATTVSYYDLAARNTVNACYSNCGVTVTAAANASHPVTVAFTDTALSGGLTLNGSLVGDAPGAAWSPSDLAGSTTSSLTLNGTPVRVVTALDSVIDAGSSGLIRTVSLNLADGSVVSLNRTGNAPFSVTRVQLPATIGTCTAGCNVAVTDGVGTQLSFAGTTLSGGVVLDGTVDFTRTSGSLSTNDSGGFTPTVSNIESNNARRTLTFNVLGTAAQAGLSLVTVEVVNGRVTRAQATVGIATQVLSCFDNGAGIGIPACTGVTVASDGRSVSFANAVLRGGPVGSAARNVTFNGTVVAKGP